MREIYMKQVETHGTEGQFYSERQGERRLRKGDEISLC